MVIQEQAQVMDCSCAIFTSIGPFKSLTIAIIGEQTSRINDFEL